MDEDEKKRLAAMQRLLQDLPSAPAEGSMVDIDETLQRLREFSYERKDDADPEKEEIYQHMEGILVRLGQADMNCERLRLMAAEEENAVKRAGLEQMADLAARRLEMVATEAIELGRALAVRNQAKVQVPKEIPESIRSVEQSAYKGVEGLPKGQDPDPLAYVSTGKSDKAN